MRQPLIWLLQVSATDRQVWKEVGSAALAR